MGNLSDRMKKYEWSFDHSLPQRMPVVLRCDGKAFHSYTKGCAKPFDENLITAMNNCAIELCKEIQGAQFAFVQSDEISILIHGYKKLDTQSWFDNRIQKMVSVGASTAASNMTAQSLNIFGKVKIAKFDARVWVMPEGEVCNYFLWRQQDWTRNSVQMLARKYYSYKECFKKNNTQLQDMIHEKGDNWNDLPIYLKRGRCIIKKQDGEKQFWATDNKIPIFSQDRNYIEQYLAVEE